MHNYAAALGGFNFAERGVVLLTELAERVAALEADVDSLKEYQEKQNGHMQRIEAKVDKIYLWLIGLMGGVITSLLLLVAQFFAGK